MKRFWAKVTKNAECWVWTGSRSNKGYGQVWHEGRLASAHRLSWIIAHGPIPEGQWVLHRCDNPPCVRPSHLYLGSASDNMKDCAQRGRSNFQTRPLRADQHLRAKLSWDQVREIRTSNATGTALAHKMGVNHTTIYRIRKGRSWRPS